MLLKYIQGLFKSQTVYWRVSFWSRLYNVQKRVFVQYCTCTDKGFGILLPDTPAICPSPPPHSRILLCTCILYNINWDCCITCGGGDLLKCTADSKADDGNHAHAHSHNNNRLFTFKFKDTDHKPPRDVMYHHCPEIATGEAISNKSEYQVSLTTFRNHHKDYIEQNVEKTTTNSSK